MSVAASAWMSSKKTVRYGHRDERRYARVVESIDARIESHSVIFVVSRSVPDAIVAEDQEWSRSEGRSNK